MDSYGALYVHVPFCRSRCNYCDFATEACSDRRLMDGYVEGVETCIRAAARTGLLGQVETAYVGGGTPTLLGADALGALLGCVSQACPGVRELSFEANPDSATDEVLKAAKAAGATRVSLGVQSFDAGLLKLLGRAHDAEQARRAIGAAKACGLDVSCDLICGIPGQNAGQLADSVGAALDAGVDHLSCYPLMIEDGTPFFRMCEAGELDWPDDDEQAADMEEVEGLLRAADLERYEVASYARPDHACRHNEAYWTGVPYLGIGRAAASMCDAGLYEATRAVFSRLDPAAGMPGARMRFTCTSDASDFARIGAGVGGPGELAFDVETLTNAEAVAEDLMLAARMSAGVGPELAARARRAFGDTYDRAVKGLATRGLVSAAADGTFAPTEEGWLLGNIVYGELWGLADSIDESAFQAI